MFKFSPQKRLIALVVTTLVLWSFFAFLIYNVLMRNIKDLSQKIKQTRLDLAQLDYNTYNFDYFANSYKEVSGDLERMSSIILEEKQVIIFVQKLEKIAADVGVSQTLELKMGQEDQKQKDSDNEDKKGEKQSAVAENQEFKSLVYRLDLQGDFPSIMRYIQALENLDNYTNINSINLSLEQRKEEVPSNLVRAIIEAEIYVK